MTDQTNSREVALDALYEILEKGGMSHVILGQALLKYQYLEKQDRALITRIVEGTLSRAIQLDFVIDTVSSTKVKKMKPLIRTLLRMSAYQILFLQRVPDSAVCNEAVKLAKKRRFEGLSGFVNGVLRSISRKKEEFVFSAPSLKYSVPEWMYAMWEGEYGKETAETVCASFLEASPLMVRLNRSTAKKEEVLESLAAQGIQAEESELFPDLFTLKGYDYLEQTEAFCRGLITVQDASSSLAAVLSDPKPGNFILDVCSAPGGKTLHAADLLQLAEKDGYTGIPGLVEARDLTEQKISLVEDNVRRCGFSNIRTRVWDATRFDSSMEGRADIVLADLPCSGLGIMGKKPDIKLRLKQEELLSLASLQREILSVVSRYVKPGGTLLYSTCTISRAENEENVQWMLDTLPFREKEIAPLLPEKLRKDCRGNRIQLLPGIHPCDGFFLAAFERET